jgi:two-component system, OmpR family, sensor histidine kinase VanS
VELLLELHGPNYVRGDALRIGQVLTNLLSNAMKHTPERGKIRIRTIAENEDVRVEVYNEGEPIPEADLPRIWETFYTVEKSHNREHAAGSGIGLAIVYNILSLHDSKFGVFNTSRGAGDNDHTGVTFYFTLRTALLPKNV